MTTYSQCGQDEYIKNTFFINKVNGYYIDIGANNGITASNTKMFEELGWNGICIEPNPDIYQQLIKNRKCICVEGAISNIDQEYVEFCQIEGYSEMLSGILDTYDENHKRRILNEQQIYGGTRKKIKVKNFRFSDIVTEKNIDYLSIDTEGSELGIVKSINFNEYDIEIISVENNSNTNDIKCFLESVGYKYITRRGADEIYQKIK